MNFVSVANAHHAIADGEIDLNNTVQVVII